MKNRSLLMIPGRLNLIRLCFLPWVHPPPGHLAPNFIEAFGQALERTRHTFQCAEGQPFVLPEPVRWVWIPPVQTLWNRGITLW